MANTQQQLDGLPQGIGLIRCASKGIRGEIERATADPAFCLDAIVDIDGGNISGVGHDA